MYRYPPPSPDTTSPFMTDSNHLGVCTTVSVEQHARTDTHRGRQAGSGQAGRWHGRGAVPPRTHPIQDLLLERRRDERHLLEHLLLAGSRDTGGGHGVRAAGRSLAPPRSSTPLCLLRMRRGCQWRQRAREQRQKQQPRRGISQPAPPLTGNPVACPRARAVAGALDSRAGP